MFVRLTKKGKKCFTEKFETSVHYLDILLHGLLGKSTIENNNAVLGVSKSCFSRSKVLF